MLIKAARPRPAPLPGLHRVGLHGSLAYYCAGKDSDGRWRKAFERRVLEERLTSAVRENFVEVLSALLVTEHAAEAERALAGWLDEAEELAGRSMEAGIASTELESLRGEIAAARPLAATGFTPRQPTDLIGCAEADALLRAEFSRRGFEVDGTRLSIGRLLTLLRPWPAGKAGRRGNPARYRRAQIMALCAWRWPRGDEDPGQGHACFLAARYEWA